MGQPEPVASSFEHRLTHTFWRFAENNGVSSSQRLFVNSEKEIDVVEVTPIKTNCVRINNNHGHRIVLCHSVIVFGHLGPSRISWILSQLSNRVRSGSQVRHKSTLTAGDMGPASNVDGRKRVFGVLKIEKHWSVVSSPSAAEQTSKLPMPHFNLSECLCENARLAGIASERTQASSQAKQLVGSSQNVDCSPKVCRRLVACSFHRVAIWWPQRHARVASIPGHVHGTLNCVANLFGDSTGVYLSDLVVVQV